MANEIAPQSAPAGWYPDPTGTPAHRWWSGTAWTEHAVPATAPYGASADSTPSVPSTTATSTPWIWLIVFVPLVSVLPNFGWDVGGYMVRSMTDPFSSMLMLFDPWYLATILLGWVAYGLAAWFAYLDRAELGRRGYRRRVHWAWSLLYSVGYVIARSIVVRRQTGGRGAAPMLVAITLSAALFVVMLVWMFAAVTVGLSDIVETGMSTHPA